VLLVLAIVLASSAPTLAQANTKAAKRSAAAPSPGHPFPEIEALLARKPNARIAVIQGSFDWVHNGHVQLMKTIARDKHQGGYDMIFVLPTRNYEKKPFLRASFYRRIRLLDEAVAEEPDLAGKVVVSRSASQIPNRPDELVDTIASHFSSLRFSYVLGADSYNDSANWPWHRRVEQHPQVEVVVVERKPDAKYKIIDPSRAARILRGPISTASSTVIRMALMAGDLSKIRWLVPLSTLRGLQRELTRREKERPPGGNLLEGPHYSERAFAEIQKEIPAGARNFLAGLDEPNLSEAARVRHATVQERVNIAHRDLAGVTLHVSGQPVDPEKEEQDKYILLARKGGRITGWYAFKPTSEQEARRLESISLLSNLLGVVTPHVMPHVYKNPFSPMGHKGVLIPWAPGLVSAAEYDFTRATARVREGMVLSRWFAEVMGNTRVKPEHFLRPITGAAKWDELLHVEQGDVFSRPEPGWKGTRFRFDRALAWAPTNYDSPDSMYGRLWCDYVLGRMDLDLEAVKRRLAVVKEIPRETLIRALKPYLDAAANDHWHMIALAGADKTFLDRLEGHGGIEDARVAVERMVIDRIYRSVGQYSAFLDRMAAGRADPTSDVYRYYYTHLNEFQP